VSAAPTLIKSVISSQMQDATASDAYGLPENVFLVVAEDGTGRLLDLAGNVCAITTSGTVMLEMVLRGQDFDAACQALADQFHADPPQVHRDMDVFLRDLERQHLLLPPGSTRRRPWSVGRKLCWLIAPILYLCAFKPDRWLKAKAWVLLTLAYLSTRAFGWPDTVSVWESCTSSSARRRDKSSDDAGMLSTIDAVATRAITRHPLNLGCRERALCCQNLARAAGLPAKIVLGVDLFPFALHCWCESGSRILADRYEGRCDRYTPLAVYS
jgi:transglutaminase superfamily protein/coenzyme PQQ synthesis protein D (PqqD)